MKPFMDEDFLLASDTAKALYHSYAETMPIVDYHCHVNPKEIAGDRRFDNIAQVWLGGDHYKWRLMRANGVDENEITGDAPDRVKFQRFAEAMPRAIGNPLYHWTHLELKRYFGIDKPLSPATADEIWEACNAKLREPGMSVRGIIAQSKVDVLCTTDAPTDTLEYHKKIAADPSFKTKVLPAFRPDRELRIDKPEFAQCIHALAKSAGIAIKSFDDLCAALEKRVDFFDSMGCRAADHGLDSFVFRHASKARVDSMFRDALAGEIPDKKDTQKYQTAVQLFLAQCYAKRGWVMQLHVGVLRNTNSRQFERIGPDTGFDCIGQSGGPQPLIDFLDALEAKGNLPKTIVYSLDPNDNAMLATVLGSFQSGCPGKLQHGSAWWFNDTRLGMEAQMKSLASLSLLGNFVGMLTDSRSFLSYTRHEYFRRILCGLIGSWVENGEYPADLAALGRMIQDISYNNARTYFGF